MSPTCRPNPPSVRRCMPGDHVAVRWQDDYLVVGHRAGPPAVHPDGDRQRRGLHRRRRRHPAGRATGRPRTARTSRPTSCLRATGWARRRLRAWSRSTNRWSGRTRRRPTGAPGSCCGPTRNTRASRRSAGSPASPGSPATWWRRRRASQISWPATGSMPARSAASTTSTGRPRSASNARPGRRSRAAAPSPPRTAQRGGPTCGGRRARITRSRGCGFGPARRRRPRCC